MPWGPPKSPKSGTKQRAAYKEGRRGLGAAPYDHAGEDFGEDDGEAVYSFDDPDEGSLFITPGRTDEICNMVREGVAIPTAAAAMGIPDSLWSSWLETARKHKADRRKPGFGVNESPYVYFLARVNQAKAQCEASLAMAIHGAAKHDFKAATWHLERMASKRYHLATKLDIAASMAGGDKVDIGKLGTAELLRLAKGQVEDDVKALPADTNVVDGELEGE